MSKGLRSYPKEERDKVATRRLKGNGLGHWGAVDYFETKKKQRPPQRIRQ